MGPAGPEGSIQVRVPPDLGWPAVAEGFGETLTGIEAEGVVLVLLTAEVVGIGAVVAGLEAAVVVAAGAVVVGVLVPQPVITRAPTRTTIKGTNSFFILSSAVHF